MNYYIVSCGRRTSLGFEVEERYIVKARTRHLAEIEAGQAFSEREPKYNFVIRSFMIEDAELRETPYPGLKRYKTKAMSDFSPPWPMIEAKL